MKPKDKRPRYKDVYEFTDIAVKGFFQEHRFLSNYHICDIVYEGRTYPSTENAYQAAKFPDAVRKKFQYISPLEAKKLGNQLKMNKEQRERWEQKKLDVMRDLSIIKYQDPTLRKRLLATGDRYLEETNYWGDTFWGVHKKFGQNKLGKLLMEVRASCQPEVEP
jgi:ribA/ribD-fused uncharacterized protein